MKMNTNEIIPSDFKGTDHYQVIERNIKNGGKILKVEYLRKDDYKIFTVTTDYADGLTITEEKLAYKKDFLDVWTIQFNKREQPALLFSREEYNEIKGKTIESLLFGKNLSLNIA
ncbi:hypothetical protein [Domibacillus tundrae]|uniref:hypothetical protein n=1 Tax=Domibacillus tundrae TaxID=1587527 RepID=UPI000618068E|nr:hypothetical protein [Domibacillus tundrae]